MPDNIAYEEAVRRASVLKMQAKKNQIFKEYLQEAAKLAEAGLMHLRAAESLPEEERVSDLKEAAICLSRAKRLSRGLVKEAR